jgi:hypothetical protein
VQDGTHGPTPTRQSNRTRAEDPHREPKPHLTDYHLPNPVVEAYAMMFYHKGKFVLVRTEIGKNRGYAAFATHVSSIPGYRRVDLEGVESGVGKLRRVHLAETWNQHHLSLPSQPPVLPPGNPSALAEKKGVLLQSAEAHRELAVRSRQRPSQFDWPVVVDRYLENLP